jgi:hypothetical protein
MQALTLAGALIESLLRPLFGQTVSYVDPGQTAFDPVVISGRKILCAVKGAKQYRDVGGVIILKSEGRSAFGAKASLSDR